MAGIAHAFFLMAAACALFQDLGDHPHPYKICSHARHVRVCMPCFGGYVFSGFSLVCYAALYLWHVTFSGNIFFKYGGGSGCHVFSVSEWWQRLHADRSHGDLRMNLPLLSNSIKSLCSTWRRWSGMRAAEIHCCCPLSLCRHLGCFQLEVPGSQDSLLASAFQNPLENR